MTREILRELRSVATDPRYAEAANALASQLQAAREDGRMPETMADLRMKFATGIGTMEIGLVYGQRNVTLNDNTISLGPTEHSLLLILATSANEAVKSQKILEELGIKPSSSNLNQGPTTAVSRLRKSLGDTGETPTCIVTVPKVGYMFVGTPISPSGS